MLYEVITTFFRQVGQGARPFPGGEDAPGPVCAGVPAAKDGPKNAVVTRAIDNLKKLRPAPLGLADEAARIEAANYDEQLYHLLSSS